MVVCDVSANKVGISSNVSDLVLITFLYLPLLVDIHCLILRLCSSSTIRRYSSNWQDWSRCAIGGVFGTFAGAPPRRRSTATRQRVIRNTQIAKFPRPEWNPSRGLQRRRAVGEGNRCRRL